MRLAYDDPGTGEPAVVLIHGWGFGNPSALVPQFEHLAKRRRVLKLDLPGHCFRRLKTATVGGSLVRGTG